MANGNNASDLINSMSKNEIEEMLKLFKTPEEIEELKKLYPDVVAAKISTHDNITIEIAKPLN